MTLLINNDVTDRVLTMADALEAIESAFDQLGRGEATFYPRSDLVAATADRGDYYAWGSMLGAVREPPRLALRLKSDVLAYREEAGRVREEKFNVEPGTYMGVVLLFDMTDGALLAVINDGELQHERVGATAGVACDYLARDDAATVGIIGSGGMARSYARAFAAVRDLDEIRSYSPTRAHREAFAADAAAELGVPVEAVDSPADAVRGADVAATCTSAEEPVFSSDWLEPGMTLIDVRSTEIGQDTLEAVDRVLGTTNVGHESRTVGDVSAEAYRRRRGARGFEPTDYPTLDEVIAGTAVGRRDGEETIYYHNRSAGIQFAAVGSVVYDRARDRGLGTPLPLAWFQQSIRN